MLDLVKKLQKHQSLKEKIKLQKNEIPIRKKVIDKFKMLDMYGEPISLCFEGNSKYKTIIGATFSVIVVVILITYFFFKLNEFVSSDNYTYSTYTEVVDIQSTKYDFNVDDISIYFGLTQQIKPEYGSIEFSQVSHTKEINSSSTNQVSIKQMIKPIMFSICNSSYLIETLQGYQPQLYCPLKNQTMTIGGTQYNQQNLEYIELNVYKCLNQTTAGVTCKTQTEIDEYFKAVSFVLPIKNNYLDSHDFLVPIKSYLDDKFFWNFAIEMHQTSWLQMQVNEVGIGRDQISGKKETQQVIQVFSSTNAISNFDKSKGLMLTVQFRLDKLKQTYSSSIYQLVDLLKDVGGMKTTLFSIGFMISSMLNRKLQYASIIKRIYQIQIKDKINKRRASAFQISGPTSSKSDQEEKSKSQEFNIEKIISGYNKQLGFKQEFPMFQKIRKLIREALAKRRKKIDVSDFIKHYMEKLYLYITGRRYLKYRLKEILYYLCCCLFLRSRESLRDSKVYKEYFYYQKGETKLRHELDVVTLIKSIRQLRLFAQVLLNENQRLLLRYQRANLIESQTSSSCDSDFNELDNVSLKKSMKDSLLSRYMQERTQNSLKYFQDKSQNLSKVDKRIIAGLVFRTVKINQITMKKKSRKEKKISRKQSLMNKKYQEKALNMGPEEQFDYYPPVVVKNETPQILISFPNSALFDTINPPSSGSPREKLVVKDPLKEAMSPTGKRRSIMKKKTYDEDVNEKNTFIKTFSIRKANF